MTRLGSTAKAGFYPTPDRVTELITRFVVPTTSAESARGRLLDPCAGEGIAAQTVAQAWHLEGYGIEIDAARALAASSRLHRVLHLDYAQARAPLRAFQVLYANPPYDYDLGEGKRLEYTCLRETTKWLCARGLLVFLVPQYRVDARMVGFLAASFKGLRAYKFPDPEYKAFKQVVIFGIAKNEPARDDTAALALLSACRGALPVLPDDPGAEERYTLPAPLPEDPKRAFYFRGNELNPQEALDEALKRGVWASDEWRDLIEPHRAFDGFRPLMPLKKGHLATLIAAGMMQNILLENQAERVLVKGRTYKVQEEVETAEEDEEEVVRDRFVTEIIALDLNTGEHTQINEPSALADFIEKWREALVARVQETFRPLYEFNLDAEGPRVNATLDGLSKNRRLPGRAENGLFPAQKHVSVALWKRLQSANSAICVGEMGTGKTTVAITVSELLRACTNDARPSLVLCPPHLIAKWIREIQETAPGAFAMELRRIGDVPDFVRRVKTLAPGTPAYAVVSREMAKLGSGWKPAYIKRRLVLREEVRKRDEGEGWGWHDVVHWAAEEVLACPNCGHPICEVEGGREYGYVHDPGYLAKRKRFCFQCRAPLFQMTHLNGVTRAGTTSLALLGSNPGTAHQGRCGNGNPGTCGPDQGRSGHGRAKANVTERYPIADYIARRYPGFFKLLIANEVHQAKGQSTDQGYAFGALARACAKTLALTGTIYGGRATSLFFLLYRLLPQVRAEFKWTDAQRWAERYGILERVTKRDQGDEGNGVYSAKRRSKTYVRELPGASPELAARLLDGAAFVTLADLGFPLPEYVEFAEEVAMSERQAETYAKLDRELSDELQDRLAQGDQSLLGAYLQALLGRPAASFRDEVVVDKYGEVVATAPAIDELMFPKEKWLVALCQRERQRGRKVLVYCRQTATRDITPRLVSLLASAHLRADTLKANVEASKREAWLHKRMGQGMLDVLITNPKLVETGLDLVAFQTVVWFETDYSLYTVMQAARRTWRLGQTQPVAVWYAVYVNTMEHRAAALIGQKLAAAKLLYGDAVEGALIQNADVGRGLLTELARNAIAGTQVDDLHAYFKRAALAAPNENPGTCCPGHVSPRSGAEREGRCGYDGNGRAKSDSNEHGEPVHPPVPAFVLVMPLALPLSAVTTGKRHNGNGHVQPEPVRGVAIPLPLGFPVDAREVEEGATEVLPLPPTVTKPARQLVLF